MSANEPVAPADPNRAIEAIEGTPEGSQAPSEPKPDEPGQQPPAEPSPEAAPGNTQDKDKDPEAEYKTRTRRRIDQLLREAASERTRAQMLAERLAELEGRNQQPSKPADELKEPDPEAFGLTPENFSADGMRKYQQALDRYLEQKWSRSLDERLEATTQQQSQAAQRQQSQASWASQTEKAKAAHEDFDLVAMSPELPVSQELALLIPAMENGAEFLYWLGQNRAEADRIKYLQGPALFREVGRLEARMDAANPASPNPAPPQKPTGAPKPPGTVGAGSPTQDTSPEAAKDFRDFEKRLHAEQTRRRS